MKQLFTAALIISVTVAMAWAGGPANKATGDLTVSDPYVGNCGLDSQFRQMDFNAHEAKDDRPAKGVFTETVLCPDGSIARYFEAAVLDVCVFEDGTANFLIKFTYDSFNAITGRYDQMTVEDLGEPGDLDSIKRSVLGNAMPTDYDCAIDAVNVVGDGWFAGNVQVHYR